MNFVSFRGGASWTNAFPCLGLGFLIRALVGVGPNGPESPSSFEVWLQAVILGGLERMRVSACVLSGGGLCAGSCLGVERKAKMNELESLSSQCLRSG